MQAKENFVGCSRAKDFLNLLFHIYFSNNSLFIFVGFIRVGNKQHMNIYTFVIIEQRKRENDCSFTYTPFLFPLLKTYIRLFIRVGTNNLVLRASMMVSKSMSKHLRVSCIWRMCEQ